MPEMKCRCCDKSVYNWYDDYPIHTKCIPKHWGKHAHGINCSRCKEFAYKAKKTTRRPIHRNKSVTVRSKR